jgi:hypothetical protein
MGGAVPLFPVCDLMVMGSDNIKFDLNRESLQQHGYVWI